MILKKTKKIFFIFLSLIISLVILEMGLRISSYAYLIIKSSGRLNAIRSKNENEINILCLGDSFTFGMGADYENSYPRQLERLLNNNGIKHEFNIYNCGYPGANSVYVLKRLQMWIDKYKPDLIVLMAGHNDYWNIGGQGGIVEKNYEDIQDYRLTNRLLYLLANLRIYKLVKILLVNLNDKNINRFFKINISTNIKDLDRPFNGQNSEREPETLLEHFKKGDRFRSENKYDLALKEFGKQADINPDDFDTTLKLACLYRNRGEYSLALELFEKARRLNPDSPWLYNELTFIHIIFKDYESARLDIMKAAEGPKFFYECLAQLEMIVKDEEAFNRKINALKRIVEIKYKNKRKKFIQAIDRFMYFKRNRDKLCKLLENNLIKIFKITEKNGIKMIMLTYPIETWANNIIKEISQKLDVPLVDIYPVFRSKLELGKEGNFFVADGHCNAGGYKIIAENVYDTLIVTNLTPNYTIQ